MIRGYIIWRNNHAHAERLRRVAERANGALYTTSSPRDCPGLAPPGAQRERLKLRHLARYRTTDLRLCGTALIFTFPRCSLRYRSETKEFLLKK